MFAWTGTCCRSNPIMFRKRWREGAEETFCHRFILIYDFVGCQLNTHLQFHIYHIYLLFLVQKGEKSSIMDSLGKGLHSSSVSFLSPVSSSFPFSLNLSPLSFFLISRAPPHTPSVSCIVNSSQKRDKVSAHVPPASLSVLPAICYCLLTIMCVCLSLSWVLSSVFFFLCVRKPKVN